MGRRKTDRFTKLITCGDIAVPARGNAIQALKTLQGLIRLKVMGLNLEGNTVDILRMKYDASDQMKIKKEAGSRGGMLIFHDEHDSIREEKIRLGKKKIMVRELIAAACSDELFTLIDLNRDMFTLLQEEEALAVIDTEWKKGRHEAAR